MTEQDIAALEKMAFNVRRHIIRLSTDGGCFIGASLSCADVIVYLYNQFLNVHQGNLDDPTRDYFFLSKGHDVPALYGTFVELGWMDAARLRNHLHTNDTIYWHPNRNVPGVEFHSGSLGHLLSVSVGVALDCRLREHNNKVVVMTGDGELNEGSNWEAMLVASAQGLDNLVVVVDRNAFQANMRTEDLIPLESLEAKFTAFGLVPRRVDGHDFAALHEVFSTVPFATGKPSVIIADTVRGKGLPSIQERADRWFVNFTHDEVEQLLAELAGEHEAVLTSEALMVR